MRFKNHICSILECAQKIQSSKPPKQLLRFVFSVRAYLFTNLLGNSKLQGLLLQLMLLLLLPLPLLILH